MVNVRAPKYGTLGSGNDTAVFEAARDAAGANGQVNVPSGNYVLANFMANVPGQTWHLYPGAVLYQRDGCNQPVFRARGPRIRLLGGTIVGNRRKQTSDGSGVTVEADDCLVNGTEVTDCFYVGVGIYNCHRAEIAHCRILGNGPGQLGALFAQVLDGSTYDAPSVHHCHIDQTSLTDPLHHGATFNELSGIWQGGGFSHNVVRGPAGGASYLTAGIGAKSHGTRVSDNDIYGFDSGVTIPNGPNAKVIGNNIFGGTFYGIEIAASPGAKVIGNDIDGKGSLSSGIACIGTPQPNSADCVVEGNGVMAVNGAGIAAWGMDDVVRSNRVSWTTTSDIFDAVSFRSSGGSAVGNRLKGPGHGNGIVHDGATTIHDAHNEITGVSRGIVASAVDPVDISYMLVKGNIVPDATVAAFDPANAVFTPGKCRIVGNVGIADHDY